MPVTGFDEILAERLQTKEPKEPYAMVSSSDCVFHPELFMEQVRRYFGEDKADKEVKKSTPAKK